MKSRILKKMSVFVVSIMLINCVATTVGWAGEPNYGSGITVDGDYSDWDLGSDHFADMYRAGDPTKPVESKLYLRYDCNPCGEGGTMYVLVLAEPGVTVLNQPNDAFVKLGTSYKLVDGNSGNNGTPPDFTWVYEGEVLKGWEASFYIDPGSYSNLNVHTQVDDGGSQTSAVSGRAIPLYIECPEPEPSIDIEKLTCDSDADSPTGPTILVGNPVEWTYVVTNTGNVTLYNAVVTDDVLGEIGTIELLAPDESQELTAEGTADAGQYANVGRVTATPECGLDEVSDEDTSHYFGVEAKIAIEKIIACAGGDVGSDELTLLPGSAITWQYTVTNPGDVLLSNVDVTDSDLGVTPEYVSGDDGDGMLDPGETWIYEATGFSGEADYANTGTAKGKYEDDCGNIATPEDNDDSSYIPANPMIDIDKVTVCAGDEVGSDDLIILEGSDIVWQYTVTNLGNVPLSNVTVTDDQGVPVSLPKTTLEVGESMVGTATDKAGIGLYENTGTAEGEYTDDCGNIADEIVATDKSSYFGVNPSFTVSKECDCESSCPVPQEGPAVFKVTFSNDGNVDLTIETNEQDIGTFVLAADEIERTFIVEIPGPFTDWASVSNEITASSSYEDDCGNTWSYTQSADDTCDVAGRVNVLKQTNGVFNPDKTWTFSIYEGIYGDGGTLLISDSTYDEFGVLKFEVLDLFESFPLDPAKTYTLVESDIPAGWSSIWQVAGVIVPTYNPDFPEDKGFRAFVIEAGTIPVGGTLVFEINNTMPGGDARTPGYWKNWNTVTGGGQAANAERNGGWEEGFWLLDDVFDRGITLGDFHVGSVVDAVAILDQRDIDTGKKMARDAAYTLAMHLLAYECNQTAGAYDPPAETVGAAFAAHALLAEIGFVGTGDYLRPKGATADDYEYALELAKILDSYNNNEQQ